MSRLSTRARADRRLMTLRFPFRGVDGAAPLSALPEGACPDMLNMFPRAQDAGTSDVSRRRYVGAKRPGLTKTNAFGTQDPQRIYGLATWDVLIASLAQQYIIASTAAGLYHLISPFTAGWQHIAGYSPGRPTFAALGQHLYLAGFPSTDLVHYVDATTGVPTANALSFGGILPGVDLCAAYRARLVVASSYRSQFAMSKVGDTTSGDAWNFASTSVNGAYLGNATGPAGVPGDRITALIPFGDDYLIFGGATSLWKLRGDPRYGGRVDSLTQRVGVLDRLAWCFDPHGTLWFVGSDYGLYRVGRSSMEVEEVLRGRAEPWLAAVLRGSTSKTAQLVYDPDQQMVLVLIVPTSQASTPSSADTHIAYHPGLDALFPFSFPVGVPPFAACSHDQGRVFFGGASGSGGGTTQRPVGTWTPGTQKLQDWDSDSGTEGAEANFRCFTRFAPLEPGGRWMARRLRAVGSHNTGSCSWYWLTGASADEVQRQAYASAYRATGTFFGAASGFQQPVGIRLTGQAHQLVIDQTSSADLRLESFHADLEYAGIERSGS